MDMKLDSWTIDQDGITYQVALYADDDANANPGGEGDVYEAADLEAHARGDWEFVGVVVTPVVNGTTIEAAQDSLWSVEYGSNPGRWQGTDGRDQVVDREYLTSVHPVPGMIPEVRGNLQRLYGQLAGVSLDDCGAYNPGQAPISGHQVANAHCMRAAGHDMPHRDLDSREWNG